ncbi:uncharacterized protein LOC142868169, partial [Microcebus murinus]|uniref:uncharacterized protein LOC142868167 n=1 Tax=Microcebus murinus TaxID=30608 RepID=UPI003F6D94F6
RKESSRHTPKDTRIRAPTSLCGKISPRNTPPLGARLRVSPLALVAQTTSDPARQSRPLTDPQADSLLLDSPPLYPPLPQVAPSLSGRAQPSAPLTGGPAQGTRSRRVFPPSPDSTVACPLRPVPIPNHSSGEGDDAAPLQLLQYWPFSTADLYNWKTNHPPFSEDPQRLTGLVESLMFSHQPTWDDCQQLLQTLFTTEERERIILEARKNVPGPDGRPTQLPPVVPEASGGAGAALLPTPRPAPGVPAARRVARPESGCGAWSARFRVSAVSPRCPRGRGAVEGRFSRRRRPRVRASPVRAPPLDGCRFSYDSAWLGLQYGRR